MGKQYTGIFLNAKIGPKPKLKRGLSKKRDTRSCSFSSWKDRQTTVTSTTIHLTMKFPRMNFQDGTWTFNNLAFPSFPYLNVNKVKTPTSSFPPQPQSQRNTAYGTTFSDKAQPWAQAIFVLE